MKKLIFAVLYAAVLFPAMAEEAPAEQDFDIVAARPDSKEPVGFITYYITSGNLNLSTVGSWNERHKLKRHGYGLAFGRIINDYFKLEFTSGWDSVILDGYDEEDDVSVLSIMVGGRLEKKFLGFVSPYIGIGAGPALTLNTISYTETDPWGGSESKEKSAFKLNLAYYAKVGAAVDITEAFGLDFSIVWKNIGGVKNKVDDFDIKGDMTSFEYRVGLSYKF